MLFLSLFSVSCMENQVHFRGLSDQEIAVASIFEKEPKPHEKKEVFEVGGYQTSKVDILMVVDSSQSMFHHLDQLGQSLSDLLSVIKGYDWQIGFITANHGRGQKGIFQDKWQNYVHSKKPRYGRLMNLELNGQVLPSRILNKKKSNYKKIFYHTLSHALGIDCKKPPYCSGNSEQPLRSLKSAIERYDLDNKDFFRPEADLVTIIVGNEDERSDDQARATRAQEVVDSFNETFKGQNKNFINFNIVITNDNCRRQEQSHSGVATVGSIVMELAQLTKGQNIDICTKDYGLQLRTISQHIKQTLNNSLVLKNKPIPETVEIDFVDKLYREIPWSLVGKRIIFNRKVADPMKVVVYYKTSSKQ